MNASQYKHIDRNLYRLLRVCALIGPPTYTYLSILRGDVLLLLVSYYCNCDCDYT